MQRKPKSAVDGTTSLITHKLSRHSVYYVEGVGQLHQGAVRLANERLSQ